MWRRSLSTYLATLSRHRSLPFISHIADVSSSSTSSFRPKLVRHFTAPSAAENVSSSKVEDVKPIATNPSKEELEALLDGRQVLDVDYPEGPFGTKVVDFLWLMYPSILFLCFVLIYRCFYIPPASLFVWFIDCTLRHIQKESPAVIKSYYDKRIIGCPGPEGDDEHDIAWFWLEKGKPQECPVCSQCFILEVVGPGGDPDGHRDDVQQITQVSS